uniref:Putative secreted protein n=1 Tax=Anopheles darlingi TaxID=43151 RepID=A0A2M4DK07_ANODA
MLVVMVVTLGIGAVVSTVEAKSSCSVLLVVPAPCHRVPPSGWSDVCVPARSRSIVDNSRAPAPPSCP